MGNSRAFLVGSLGFHAIICLALPGLRILHIRAVNRMKLTKDAFLRVLLYTFGFPPSTRIAWPFSPRSVWLGALLELLQSRTVLFAFHVMFRGSPGGDRTWRGPWGQGRDCHRGSHSAGPEPGKIDVVLIAGSVVYKDRQRSSRLAFCRLPDAEQVARECMQWPVRGLHEQTACGHFIRAGQSKADRVDGLISG